MIKEELLKHKKGLKVALDMRPHLTTLTKEEKVSQGHVNREWDVNWDKIEELTDLEYKSLLFDAKSSNRIQEHYSSYENFLGLMSKLRKEVN